CRTYCLVTSYQSCPVFPYLLLSCFFFFNDPATTEIYTLSLHDALPILSPACGLGLPAPEIRQAAAEPSAGGGPLVGDRRLLPPRSEEHTSELQSRENLVCRLLLEKKKKKQRRILNKFKRRERL